MSDNSSGFPGFHSHSYGSDYARPVFRVASFSDEQELHVSSPRSRSDSLSRTPSKTSVSGKLSMKKMQQALDEKSMEDEGNGRWRRPVFTYLIWMPCGLWCLLMTMTLFFLFRDGADEGEVHQVAAR
jgi:hypothetical protein